MATIEQLSTNPNPLTGFVPVALYDCGISDLEKRRAKRMEFRTVTSAAKFLGISDAVLRRLLDPKRQLRATAPDGKEYAVRIISNNQKSNS